MQVIHVKTRKNLVLHRELGRRRYTSQLNNALVNHQIN